MSERDATAGCVPFDEDLSAWLDGELGAERAAEVHGHVRACARCEARAAELRAVDEGLRALADAVPSAPEAERIARLRGHLATARGEQAAPGPAAGRGVGGAAPGRAEPGEVARPALPAARAPRRRRRLPAALVGAAAAAVVAVLAVPRLVERTPVPSESVLARSASERAGGEGLAAAPAPPSAERQAVPERFASRDAALAPPAVPPAEARGSGVTSEPGLADAEAFAPGAAPAPGAAEDEALPRGVAGAAGAGAPALRAGERPLARTQPATPGHLGASAPDEPAPAAAAVPDPALADAEVLAALDAAGDEEIWLALRLAALAPAAAASAESAAPAGTASPRERLRALSPEQRRAVLAELGRLREMTAEARLALRERLGREGAPAGRLAR